ncbi:ribonuclease VapC [Spirochaetia bacterium]|nr:ribonuclease VapC [Spirochaetia bacterium]
MPAVYFLDTDICSYSIKTNPQSISDKFWEHHDDDICISVVTYAELVFGGLHKGSVKLQNRIKTFVSRLRIIDFDAAAAGEYAYIRQYLETQGTVIDDMDILIAASAKSCGAVLVTNNQKHFSRIPNLKLENWA